MPEIGTTLREARMRARIDITEVEARTKIRARYLRAIENEEWDLLPGPVYVKSFLRTYSEFLGLDSRMLVDEYKRRYEGPSDHDARPIATRTRERERERQRAARGPLVPPWALIGLVLVAIVAALYFIGAPGKKSTTSSTPRITQTQRPRPRRHRRAGAAPAPARRTVTVQLVPTGKVYICLV